MNGGSVHEPDLEDRGEDWGEDRRSVGDWALPEWVHRVGWPVWSFVGLAAADVLMAWYTWTAQGSPAPIDASIIVRLGAPAVPILLPAAVFWFARRVPLPWSHPLVLGSIAVALAVLLRTTAVAVELAVQGYQGFSGHTPYHDLIEGAAVIGAVVGPFLLARAILARRRVPAPGWAAGLGLALGVLDVGVLAFAVLTASQSLATLSGPDDPAITPFRIEIAIDFVRSLSVVGWTVLGWAVITGAGDPGHPRVAWRCAFGAMVISLGLLALSMLTSVLSFIAAPSGPSQLYDGTQAVWLAVLEVSGPASIAADVLLVAAFALGLGQAGTDVDGLPALSDDDHGLESVLRPG